MASELVRSRSAFESANIPQELYDEIAVHSGSKGMASMMLVSKHFNKAFASQHWAEVSFINLQKHLSNTLHFFIYKATNETSTNNGLPFFDYVK